MKYVITITDQGPADTRYIRLRLALKRMLRGLDLRADDIRQIDQQGPPASSGAIGPIQTAPQSSSRRSNGRIAPRPLRAIPHRPRRSMPATCGTIKSLIKAPSSPSPNYFNPRRKRSSLNDTQAPPRRRLVLSGGKPQR